jgi:DeoR family ulaG and ulaABCDEF operon transcriptional repressor
MLKLDRQRQILALLQRQEIVSVDEFCDSLQSSPATVRRDLNDLGRNNLLTRIHGGAASLSRKLGNSDFDTNLTFNNAQKKAIAEHAATLCLHGDSIIINGGTTTWLMCDSLQSKSLQILTNSLPIATTLQAAPHCQIFLTGGEVYADQHIVLGDYQYSTDGLPANDSTGMRQFYAKKMFAGANAITQHGLMESDTRLIQAEKQLMNQAEELIVLADSSKFSNEGLLQLCPLQNITRLITDDGIPHSALSLLSEASVEVTIVEVQKELRT